MRAHTLFCLCLALAGAAACTSAPPQRTFALEGQVLSLEPAKKLIVVKHGDIKGFMPAMTMPYEVKDQRLLDGLAPGDLIKATLVVLDNGAYLSDITKTGQAPIEKPPAAAAAPAASSGLGVYTGNAWTPEQVLADLKSGG